MYVYVYRVIKKSLCTWWLHYRKFQVMYLAQSHSFAADHQEQGDTRLTQVRSDISNYVIMVSDWNCLKYCCLFLYCNHQVHRDYLIVYTHVYVPALEVLHPLCSWSGYWTASRTLLNVYCVYITWGARWRSWLRQCPTSRKTAVLIPYKETGRPMALGSTQPLGFTLFLQATKALRKSRGIALLCF
jgi:hypothetical protein